MLYLLSLELILALICDVICCDKAFVGLFVKDVAPVVAGDVQIYLLLVSQALNQDSKQVVVRFLFEI